MTKDQLEELENRYLHSAERNVYAMPWEEYLFINTPKEHRGHEEYMTLRAKAEDEQIGCDCTHKFDICWCDDTCGKLKHKVRENEMKKNKKTYIERTLELQAMIDEDFGTKVAQDRLQGMMMTAASSENPDPELLNEIEEATHSDWYKRQMSAPQDDPIGFNVTDGTPENADEVQRADEIERYVSGNHYNDVVPGMQYMEMMQYMLADKSGVEAHLFGQIYKYLMRAGKKDDYEQDVRKARWYLNCLVKYIQTGKIDPHNNDG